MNVAETSRKIFCLYNIWKNATFIENNFFSKMARLWTFFPNRKWFQLFVYFFSKKKIFSLKGHAKLSCDDVEPRTFKVKVCSIWWWFNFSVFVFDICCLFRLTGRSYISLVVTLLLTKMSKMKTQNHMLQKPCTKIKFWNYPNIWLDSIWCI